MKFKKLTEVIEPITSEQIETMSFKHKYACAVVLTQDKKILLQMRGEKSKSFVGYVTTFGGTIESGEEPLQAIIRELHEELGAEASASEIVSFGTVVESIAEYSDLIYTFFWHDHAGTITGCYEGSPVYFDNIKSVKSHPKSMDYVHWLLDQCKKDGLIDL